MGAKPDASSTPPGGKEDLYKTAAEIGRQKLRDQLAELGSIRQRTLQYLAFVGAATAFLVGTALSGGGRDGGTTLFNVIGVVASVGVLVVLWLVRSILLGTKHWYGGKLMDWDVHQDATAYTEWLDQKPPPSTVTFYRSLASTYKKQAATNDKYLARLRSRYMAALFSSTLLLVVWAVLAWLYGGS